MVKLKRIGGVVLKPCSPYPLTTLFKITACLCKFYFIINTQF